MIYDKLTVALLGTLSTERHDSTNAHIARYLLAHQEELGELSVKRLAQECSVGADSVSRFCRDIGFESFDELRREFCTSTRVYEAAAVVGESQGDMGLAQVVSETILQAAQSVDAKAMAELVDDLIAYEKVSAFGMLKAQAAAVDLQVDLLMQGKLIETCVSHAEQLRRIAEAGSDELIIVFSYTGSYFDSRDLSEAMRRVARPKIWVVCGARHKLPPFVSGRLLFSSSGKQMGHPYQLEVVAGMIAQEYARRR